MEFKIIGKYNETYLKECLALWQYSSKDAFDSIKTYLICFLTFFAIGLINYLRGKSISLFISSFGLACFILLIIQVINIYEQKSRTRKNLLARIDKYKSDPTAVRELCITEEHIKYCDPEMFMEIKWNAFSHYHTNGNYIYLFLNEGKKPALSIDKMNISGSIEKDLFDLVNSKIPECG